MNTKNNDCYDADTAEAAAELWDVLASWEGEDADAQKVIELAFRKYAARRQPTPAPYKRPHIYYNPQIHMNPYRAIDRINARRKKRK